MKLITDHSFHIGEQHLRQGKPCQDYALSGTLDHETAYAIVSDGCSSGGLTDIGSRLISLATLRALTLQLNQGGGLEFIGATRNGLMETYQASLGLHPKDLLATSLFAVTNGDQVLVSVIGDGVVALQYEYGLMIISYEWNNNTPYYPIYQPTGHDAAFSTVHQGSLFPLTITTTSETTGRAVKPVDLMTGMRDQLSSYPLYSETLGQLQSLALFSDGVGQVDQFGQATAVQALLSFKSTSGQFAVRRMNRFMAESKKVGRGPVDDIAFAVIHISYEKERYHDSHSKTPESDP
jgi:hypothetical protein